jgi:hypothetical protein
VSLKKKLWVIKEDGLGWHDGAAAAYPVVGSSSVVGADDTIKVEDSGESSNPYITDFEVFLDANYCSSDHYSNT